MMAQEYSFIRYLAAKKSVDDRSLNQQVWERLVSLLPHSSPGKPLRVLEIGAGIGTMLVRLMERKAVDYADYDAIDTQREVLDYGKRYISDWGDDQGFDLIEHDEGGTIIGDRLRVDYHLQKVDVNEFIVDNRDAGRWDLIIAHAFLDLVDVQKLLPSLVGLCKPGGLLYFSLNYDGLTILEPAIDSEFDRLILSWYDRTMDERMADGKPSGDSQTGRRMFSHLSDANVQIIAAGSSDWVVYADASGYPRDEAYFLHFIVHTIGEALKNHQHIDQERFQTWISERHSQVNRRELVYIAHQIDFLGRRTG